MARIATALLGVVLALAGCGTVEIAAPPAALGEAGAAAIRAEAEAAVAAAGWPRALTRTLRIRQGAYRPLVVALRRGTPYVLKLENADDAPHAFRAPGFFQAIAVKSLVPADEEIGPGTVLSAIAVAPRQTRELAFVPLRDGSFPFSDGLAGLLLGGAFGSRGVVTID